MEANYKDSEIKSLLQKVRIFNKSIGEYEIHAITSDFNYAIKLSNGKIFFTVEELQDDQNENLTPEKLEAIANRFTAFSTGDTNVVSEPPQNRHTSLPANTLKTKKHKVVSKVALVVGILAIAIGCIKIFFNDMIDSGYESSGESYQESVMTIEEMEKAQPTNFLTISGTYRGNFWGNKIKIEGAITNSATVATYKDAVVRVRFYTKTQTSLGSQDYPIYEVLKPHSTTNFQLSVDNYKDVGGIDLEIASASNM